MKIEATQALVKAYAKKEAASKRAARAYYIRGARARRRQSHHVHAIRRWNRRIQRIYEALIFPGQPGANQQH